MQNGLSGYQEEKILIQLDTEAQGYEFKPELYFLNKFDVFTTISIASKSLLLAQKFHVILNRKRNKGRDFFDVVYLLNLETKPDYEFLKLKQGITNEKELKDVIFGHCKTLNMNSMAKDVAPFLFNDSDTKKIIYFEQFLKQQRL